jgi:hypothetical protein
LQWLWLQLEILKPKFSWEKLIIINHLIYLIDNDK